MKVLPRAFVTTPFVGAAFGRIDSPRFRSRRNQHAARLRSRDAQLLPCILYAVAGTGDLTAVEGVYIRIPDRSGDDADPCQIDFKLFSQQRGQRGVDALSHFRAVDEDGDGVISSNFEPRVQLAAGRRCSRLAAAAECRQRQCQHQAAANGSRAFTKIAPTGVLRLCAQEGGSSRLQFGGSMNCLTNSRIGAAAANVAGHRGVDIGVAGGGIAS